MRIKNVFLLYLCVLGGVAREHILGIFMFLLITRACRLTIFYMPNDDKKKRLDALLNQQGLQRASEYFTDDEKEHAPSYSDIIEIVHGATRIKTEHGEIVYRKLVVPVSVESETSTDGDYLLPGVKYFKYLDPDLLAYFCNEEQPVSLESLLFLDLETTGIAGGTGTYPVLSGVGYLRGDDFVLEQFFMEDFDREEAVLTELQQRINSARAYVTYNGKTFDIPVLRTRFMLHRVPADRDKPNIDLLHPVRSLWRGVFPECTLNRVERDLLGIQRLRDIDGSMVPQVYFDYLNRGDPKTIALVFDHNAQDVISLASILARICYYYQFPEDEEIMETQPQLGLSRLYERHGNASQSLECMERALLYCRDARLSYFISCHIARRYKRAGRWNDALELWQSHIDSGRLYNLEPFIELAKYYEHRAKEHDRAVKLVEHALEFIDKKQELSALLGELLSFDPEKAVSELTHRLQRLQRRLNNRHSLNDTPREENDES